MDDKRFSAGHIQHYSKLLLSTLVNPVILYLVIMGNVVLGFCLFLFHKYEYGVNPEVQNIVDIVYWGFATVTTVGYGDIVPVTAQGKIIAVIVMLLGVSFFLAFTSIWVTSFLAKITQFDRPIIKAQKRELEEIEKRLEKIEKLLSYKS